MGIVIDLIKARMLFKPLDFDGSDPPVDCGHTVDTGKDKVCCKTVKQRTIKPIAKKYG